MKKFLLLLSVLGNVALLVLVVSSSVGKNGNVTTSASANRETNSAAAVPKITGGPVDTSDIHPAEWQEIVTADLATQVARLRAAGFPDSVIRSIISAQLSEQYQARSTALRGSQPKPPYWQNEQVLDPKIRAAQRELSNEYSKQMTDLLGTTANDDPVYLAQQRAQYGDLPREKIDQITRVQRDYNDLRQKLYDAAGLNSGGITTITNDIQAKMSQLEIEQRNDILGLLTPQEAEDYELRSSNTASQMRSSLAAFQPNEQEFRTIFKIQKQFDEQYNTQAIAGLPSAAQQEFFQRRTEAQKELTAQIAAALGQRGAEYERTTDNNYRQVYRVVERLELPKEAATQVWETQKDIEQRMTAINKTPGITPAAARSEIALLAQEANTRVSAALGERGMEVYRQYGGAWIQNLQNRAAAAGGGAAAGAAGGGGRGGVIDSMWQIR
ncbi:MAG: hypothetical protein ABIO94_07975 [Opitutaceae bacterium]